MRLDPIRHAFEICDDFQTLVAGICTTLGGAATVKYVFSDHQGSTRALMDGNGTVIALHDYLPFGEELWSGTGMRTTTQKFGALDQSRMRYGLTEKDEATGLDHTWFRKHENNSGRWTTPDPMGGTVGDPQSFNSYSYSANDPVNLIDPSGLKDRKICGYDDDGHPIYCQDQDSIRTNTRAPYYSISEESWARSSFFGGLTQDSTPGRDPSVLTGAVSDDAIRCQPDVVRAMNNAWSQSGNAGQSRPSGSMGVEAGFNLNGTLSSYKVSSSYTNEIGKMSIKFNVGNPKTFANFHIHPGRNTSGLPSTPTNNYEGNKEGDTGMADRIYRDYGQAIQIYVMSWKGLTMYDPATKATVQLVNGTGFINGEGCPQ